MKTPRLLWFVPLLFLWGAWNPFLRRVPEVGRANDLLRGKDYKAAEEGYRGALERRASEPRLKHNLGLAFLGQNNYTAAESEFIAATSSDSELVRARGNFFLGVTRFHIAETLQQPDEKIKKFKEAADNFRRVLELEPDDEDARHNLEMTLERIEDVEKQQEEEKKKQEQQEKQQQDQKDQKDQKDQQDQQNKDQQNQDQQNKDQQNKDQQNKDQQNKDQQNKDQQNQDQQNKDQQNKDQQNQDQQNKDQQNQDQQNKDQQNQDQQNKDQQNKDQQNQDQQNQDQQNQDQQNQTPKKPETPEVKAARRALDDLKERQKQRILEMHRKGGQGRRAPIKDW